jgi:hypothetical protein
MNILWNRRAELVVGKLHEQGRNVSNLRIAFKIEKQADSVLDTSSISVYNLSSETANLFRTPNLFCTLRVGYASDSNPQLFNLFGGEVQTVSHKQDGADIITDLLIVDSQQKLIETHIEKNFSAGSTTENVLRSLLTTFGMSSQATDALISDVKTTNVSQLATQFTDSVSLALNFRDAMTSILNREGLLWTAQDGTIRIHKKGVAQKERVVLSKDSGLIGIPTYTKQGVEFTCLIQPGVLPGHSVRLISSTVNGVFKISKATYQGDTHGGKWEIACLTEA